MQLESSTLENDLTGVDKPLDSRRRESRLSINSDATEATIAYTDAEGQAQIGQGRLADLSQTGVKVSLNCRLESGSKAVLKIFVPSMDFEITRDVIIRWQQPRDATTWWTGLQTPEEFDADLIEGMAANQVLNRRRDPRYPVSMPAKVRWELTDADEDVTLKNFSKGGFCLQLPTVESKNRSRLMLIIPGGTGAPIPARVMWRNDSEDVCLVGCAFTTQEGFSQLRRYAAPTELKRQLSLLHHRHRPMSKWLAIAVLVLAAVQTVQIAVVAPETPSRLLHVWQHYIVDPIGDQLRRLTVEASPPDDAQAEHNSDNRSPRDVSADAGSE